MGYGLTINLVCLSIFGLLGLFGNAFVIFIILRKFRCESWTYILVCHLAVCDVLVSTFGAPLWIVTYTSRIFCVCRAAIFTSSLFMNLSCFTLILIAYDRWVYIHYPLRYHLIVTTRKVVSLLVAIWLFTACSAAGPVIYKMNTENAVYVKHCVLTKLVNRWALLWLFLACFLVPLFTLAPLSTQHYGSKGECLSLAMPKRNAKGQRTYAKSDRLYLCCV